MMSVREGRIRSTTLAEKVVSPKSGIILLLSGVGAVVHDAEARARRTQCSLSNGGNGIRTEKCGGRAESLRVEPLAEIILLLLVQEFFEVLGDCLSHSLCVLSAALLVDGVRPQFFAAARLDQLD